MKYLNLSWVAREASLIRKKCILVLCCGLAFGVMNAQQSVTFNYSGSIVNWTVPSCVTQVTITALGAAGGESTCWGGTGGYGAQMQGTFTVTPAQVLKILVGQQGINNCCAGGGGGTFVTTSSNAAMCIAGGGGGGGYNYGTYSNANTTTAGQQGGGTYGSGTGGSNGGGGGGGTDGGFGGGGGLLGNGGNGYYGSLYCQSGYAGAGGNGVNGGNGQGCCTNCNGGSAFVNGGAGGTGSSVNGSFGGGGGCYEWETYGGGGGGGYSGGGGGGYDYCYTDEPCCGGGGGSYNGGTNQTNTAAVGTGNGTVTIMWVAGATVITNVISNVSCNGGSNASASATINGTSPYTYLWTPSNQSTVTAVGLTAGNYTLTVKDACGDITTASVTITQPATALNVTAGTLTNDLCMGSNQGSIKSFATGGTSPYTYAWAPSGGSAAIASGLTAGVYTITLTDKHGCTASASATITQPNQVVVSVNVVTNVTCSGGSNGSLSTSVAGGTTPYTYLWNDGGAASTLNSLTAGSYTVNVTDNNGCTGSASAIISQPVALSASANTVTNVLCYGDNNGVAMSNANGGTPPYNYYWSNGGTNATEAGLSAGTYTVTITDNCGTLATEWVTITQPAAISATASVTEGIKCNGVDDGCASASATGGTAPYNYQWSDVNNQTAPTACGLSAGSYTVSITDNNGCSGSVRVTITQPAAMNIVTNATKDNGTCIGSAWINVSGGNAPYTYAWGNGNVTDSIFGQCAGVYCCDITDANGCMQNVCVNIKSTLGIANLNGGTSAITVYPNPSNGQFTIQAPVSNGQSTVEIYNVLGERVYSQVSSFNSPLTINLGNQPNGVYLYRVISESGNVLGQGKIMVQK